MDKRTVIALVLTAIVIVVGQLVMPHPPPPSAADSIALAAQSSPSPAAGLPGAAPVAVANATDSAGRAVAGLGKPAAFSASATVSASRVDSMHVVHGATGLTYIAPNAVPAVVTLSGYRDLSKRKSSSVTIAQQGAPLLRYRVVLDGNDTGAVAQLPVTMTTAGNVVRFQSASPALTIEYQPADGEYLTHVRGTIAAGPDGTKTPTALLIDLPEQLESFEADTLDDQRHHAYGYKPFNDDVASILFSKLDSTVFRTDHGPMRWVAARNKYFLLALIAPADSAHAFASLRMRGGHRGVTKNVSTATATASLPITGGTFSFDMYAGPQSYAQLHAIGGDLENVNPYAGITHPVAQPIVTIVMRVLLWLKGNLHVNYGWVLVIFGVSLRLLMWPLNQKAMRSSIKMQRIQPELQAVQKKYEKDPEGQRTAMMKLYASHGMSPLSPLLGCLPMLLPMPILFALYFVFQNTIEFRGVPFLWLPDLALRDPFFVTPVFMGASMFLLSWMGMRNAPPNPQTKMMSYMMPIMMTALFLNFASGLNLYYAVQNLIAIPQQWLLSRERARSTA